MGNTKDLAGRGRTPSCVTPSAEQSERLRTRQAWPRRTDGILYLTDAVTPPSEFCCEQPARLQNLLSAADDACRIPLAPVQNGVAEDLIEPSVLGQELGCKAIVECLDILDVCVFQPVFPGFVDLQPLMRNTQSCSLGEC